MLRVNDVDASLAGASDAQKNSAEKNVGNELNTVEEQQATTFRQGAAV